jgi:hypothetical protein
MIKIGFGPDGKPDPDYTIIERETGAIIKTRPVLAAFLISGCRTRLKGLQTSYVTPWDRMHLDAERGSVSIPGRHVSDAKLAKSKQDRVIEGLLFSLAECVSVIEQADQIVGNGESACLALARVALAKARR